MWRAGLEHRTRYTLSTPASALRPAQAIFHYDPFRPHETPRADIRALAVQATSMICDTTYEPCNVLITASRKAAADGWRTSEQTVASSSLTRT